MQSDVVNCENGGATLPLATLKDDQRLRRLIDPIPKSFQQQTNIVE